MRLGETIWTSGSIVPGQIAVTDSMITGRYVGYGEGNLGQLEWCGDYLMVVMETVKGQR